MKSIGRAWGMASAASSSSGQRRTINSSLLTPQHMWRLTMKVSPPEHPPLADVAAVAEQCSHAGSELLVEGHRG
ncbi:MAG TPA: hypothetical protein VHZ27_17925 [Solirubrobacteraceae bacterium]|nr:hypothetical protein [Solirubrobacteraceae bacterium]